MDEPCTILVTVYYKGMHSALTIDLSEYNNVDHYLQVIKDHLNIAKNIIDKKVS